MPGAGRLRDRVVFDRRENVEDDYGNTQAEFVEQFDVAANIQARFGGEALTAARLQGQQPVTITIRQSTRTRLIKEDWRARNARSGEVYAIRSIVDPDGKRAWLEILAQTGMAA